MAVTGFSLSERFSRWQVLANNLKETGTTPLVEEEMAELASLLIEARGLMDRHEHARSESRTIRKQLVNIAQRGDAIRSRMGAILQGKLGFTNEALIRYGFTPRRVPRRRPKAVEAAKGKEGKQASASQAAPDSTTTPSSESSS